MNQTDILNLARNFMECRILLSGAELDLFTLLTPKPLTAREITDRIHGSTRGVTVLLDALSAIGLLAKKNGTYQCLPPVSNLLSADGPGSILSWVLHMANVWKRWALLTSIVQGTPREEPAAPPQDMRDLKAFIGAMHVIASPLAPQIVDAVSPRSFRRLLDVGGAMGTYTIAFLRAVPEMKATLFDRPEVIEIARQHLAGTGLLDRITLVGGDFYRDELPGGHDLVLVSAIIHQNSPEQNLDLFRKVFRSLDPGGRVIIRDHVMDPDRTRPKDGAVFAVNMLVATPGGNTYIFEEIKIGLSRAGFVDIRLLRSGEHMDALVEGFKP